MFNVVHYFCDNSIELEGWIYQLNSQNYKLIRCYFLVLYAISIALSVVHGIVT